MDGWMDGYWKLNSDPKAELRIRISLSNIIPFYIELHNSIVPIPSLQATTTIITITTIAWVSLVRRICLAGCWQSTADTEDRIPLSKHESCVCVAWKIRRAYVYPTSPSFGFRNRLNATICGYKTGKRLQQIKLWAQENKGQTGKGIAFSLSSALPTMYITKAGRL